MFLHWGGLRAGQGRDEEGSSLGPGLVLQRASGSKNAAADIDVRSSLTTRSVAGEQLATACYERQLDWPTTCDADRVSIATETNSGLFRLRGATQTGRDGKKRRRADVFDGENAGGVAAKAAVMSSTELGEADISGQKLVLNTSVGGPGMPSQQRWQCAGVIRPKDWENKPHLRKRKAGPQRSQRPLKQARAGDRWDRSEDEQRDDLKDTLQWLQDQYDIKKRLSATRAWCRAVPVERKVRTVREFYEAMHDRRTLPLRTCLICYGKCAEGDLDNLSWVYWQRMINDQWPVPSCSSCFQYGADIPSCNTCSKQVRKGVLPPAAILHGRLKCEHAYPEELKGLTPIEEKLIARNSCYGFFTKHTVVPGRSKSADYARHIRGHITVFPNNVTDLTTNVLPHPLLRVMEDIHVSWHGNEKPRPRDLAGLLSVRRRKVEAALVWLRRNNPFYKDIEVDVAEMESWGTESCGVPSQILEHLTRNEPTALEKIRTAQIVPAGERCIDENNVVGIDEILAGLSEEAGQYTCSPGVQPGEGGTFDEELDNGEDAGHTIQEINASGMFALDGQPEVADAEKLRFVCHAMGSGAVQSDNQKPRPPAASATLQFCNGHEPFIQVSRGEDFADSFEPSFFPKAFPTLFPWGVGGASVEQILAKRRYTVQDDGRKSPSVSTALLDTYFSALAGRSSRNEVRLRIRWAKRQSKLCGGSLFLLFAYSEQAETKIRDFSVTVGLLEYISREAILACRREIGDTAVFPI